MLYCSIMGFLIWKDSRVWHFAPAVATALQFWPFLRGGAGLQGCFRGPCHSDHHQKFGPSDSYRRLYWSATLKRCLCGISCTWDASASNILSSSSHHHHHDNDPGHNHHKANAALRAVRPSGRDRGSRIQSGGYILGCSQHCLNVVKVLEGSFWEGTSWDCLVTGTIHTPHMNNHIQKSLSFKN